MLANVNDHASKADKYKKGFRMLTAGWTDGNTFLPLLSVMAKIYDAENNTLDVKIVFVRDRNNKKKWIAFLSTDLSLDELQDVQFSEALKIILDILQETLQEMLFLTDEQIDNFIEAFIIKLPKYLSQKLQYKKTS